MIDVEEGQAFAAEEDFVLQDGAASKIGSMRGCQKRFSLKGIQPLLSDVKLLCDLDERLPQHRTRPVIQVACRYQLDARRGPRDDECQVEMLGLKLA